MLVFVYGTLKVDCKNYNRMAGKNSQVFIEDDFIKGELFAYGDKKRPFYPYLFAGDNWIPGEIHEIPEEAYKRIKEVETGSGYTEEEVVTKGGVKVKAFIGEPRIKEEREKFLFPIDEWVEKGK